MLERGVEVSYETIRACCDRFGQQYANQLRRRGRRPGDKWHLDEVFVQINGAQRCTCGARSTSTAIVLDILVGSRRNAVAAKKFFRRLLKGLRYVPRVIVTDKLASYQVAHRELMASVQHRRSKYLRATRGPCRPAQGHPPTPTTQRTACQDRSRHALQGIARSATSMNRPPLSSQHLDID